PPRSASRNEEMEKRSRQRVRDQVALMAFGAETRMRSSARGYPSWPGTETFRSRAGYRSARPIAARSSLSACNARPVHTEGPSTDIAGRRCDGDIRFLWERKLATIEHGGADKVAALEATAD